MTELNPDQALRRSPLYRRHQQLDARFEQLGDAVVVNAYSDTGMEPRLAISLGLADLSCLPRSSTIVQLEDVFRIDFRECTFLES